jgi:hypothetical protein
LKIKHLIDWHYAENASGAKRAPPAPKFIFFTFEPRKLLKTIIFNPEKNPGKDLRKPRKTQDSGKNNPGKPKIR